MDAGLTWYRTTTWTQRALATALLVLALLVLCAVVSGQRLRARIQARIQTQLELKRAQPSVAKAERLKDVRASTWAKTGHAQTVADDDGLAPFTISADWPPRTKRIQCLPIRSMDQTLKACALSRDHFGLFRDHLDREHAVYQLLSRTFRRGGAFCRAAVGSPPTVSQTQTAVALRRDSS